MTDLINTVFINGEKTTFLNYVNPSSGGELANFTDATIRSFATDQWGVDLSVWRLDIYSNYGLNLKIRFPVAFETKTGSLTFDIGANNVTKLIATGRCVLFQSGVQGVCSNTANTTTSASGFVFGGDLSSGVLFGVVNNQSIIFASFTSDQRTSLSGLTYVGWNKDASYTGGQYPRNLSVVGTTNFSRITRENVVGMSNLMRQNPSISCSVATTGANSTDVIVQDSTAPNNYIGKLWNMIILPTSAVVGKIYKNTGIDPDTGVIETGQKAFWMCVGSWGTDKIGMRAWTENIT